jgi:2-polyprenyl-3-methyl-5-hydroxy-6-metoxy-1,4-benzoquinol methylase
MQPHDQRWRESFERLARQADDPVIQAGCDAYDFSIRERIIDQAFREVQSHREQSPAPRYRCLDIGCNTGFFTERLYKRGIETLGVDFSPEALVKARKRLPRVTFKEADALKLDALDESFEAVTLLGVIQTVSCWKTALREMWRVLKTGGIGVLETNRRMPLPVNLLRNCSYVLRGLKTTAQAWESVRHESGVRFDERFRLTHSVYFDPGQVARELEQLGVRDLRWFKPARALGLVPEASFAVVFNR